ncbi:MAG TPA: hypothetical protein VFZ00_11270 [Solirubrobacter sp.]|nr:hypothetical protein [Solirubrobacter sp.]
MGNLPSSRTETCINGAPVNPNLINEIQDNIIGGNRAPFVRSIWPVILSLPSGTWAKGDTGATLFTPYIQCGGANNQVVLEIPCEKGETITSLTADVFGPGGVQTTSYTLYYSPSGIGSEVSIGGLNDVNRAAAWGTFTIQGGMSQLIGAGGALYLFAQGQTGYRISKMHGTFSRLP